MELVPFGQEVRPPGAEEQKPRRMRLNNCPPDTASVFHFSFLLFTFYFIFFSFPIPGQAPIFPGELKPSPCRATCPIWLWKPLP